VRRATKRYTNPRLLYFTLLYFKTLGTKYQGINNGASLALTAFLASAAGTVSLQNAILARYSCPVDSFCKRFRRTWSGTFGTSSPPPMSCTNNLSGTGRAFCAIKLQWNLAWSLVSSRPLSELLLPHTVVIGFMLYPLLRVVSVSMTSPFVSRWVCG